MSRQTIAAAWAGAPVALCASLSEAFLATEFPADFSAAGHRAAVIQQGERFAIQGGAAIVPIRGLLTPDSFAYERYFGWATYQGIEATLAELAASDAVSVIVLDINSPGGQVIGLQGAANAIAAAAAIKPVRALVNPLCASAAYWLASQASDITMTPGAALGSIGVAVQTSSAVQPGGDGTQEFVLTSSHARAKLPDAATDPGRIELQRSLDEMEAEFHAAVSAGRKIALADLPGALSVTDDVADGGAVFGPAAAMARKLSDATQTRDAFYADVFAASAPRARGGSRAYLARATAAAAIAAC